MIFVAATSRSTRWQFDWMALTSANCATISTVLEDLQKGIVRVLHPRSFIDDPTRMYRAVRYEGRYGFQDCRRIRWLSFLKRAPLLRSSLPNGFAMNWI